MRTRQGLFPTRRERRPLLMGVRLRLHHRREGPLPERALRAGLVLQTLPLLFQIHALHGRHLTPKLLETLRHPLPAPTRVAGRNVPDPLLASLLAQRLQLSPGRLRDGSDLHGDIVLLTLPVREGARALPLGQG